MYRKKKEYHHYPKSLCKKAVSFVFDTLEFDDPELWQIMHDSYRTNIRIILQHAYKYRIDELEYIFSIRNMLLKSKGVYTIER